jgi:hypothetical protein
LLLITLARGQIVHLIISNSYKQMITLPEDQLWVRSLLLAVVITVSFMYSLSEFSHELRFGESFGAAGSVGLDDLAGNSVHVLASLLVEGLSNAVLGGGVLGLNVESGDEVLLGHGFEDVADVLSTGVSLVLFAGAVSGATTVMSSHAHGADLLSHVELVHNRSGSGVKPVVVIGSKLFPAGGLDVVGPL